MASALKSKNGLVFLSSFFLFLSFLFFPLSSNATDAVSASGSAKDMQAAIDKAYKSGGGTVLIPSGTFNLGGSITVKSNVKLIGAGVGKTIIKTSGSSQVINIQGDNARVSGFSLISASGNGGNGIKVGGNSSSRVKDFRIDHLYIEGYGSQAAIYVRGTGVRGVIDNNSIKNKSASKVNYGVVVYGSGRWGEVDLGGGNAVFIEDNTFTNCRHAVASNAGAHYVFRYNRVYGGIFGHQVDAHGPAWGSDQGTQAVEVYGNVIESPVSGSNYAIGIRGGGGVIFNNTIKGYKYGIVPSIEYDQDYSLGYPITQQVHDLYIWGNTSSGKEVQVASFNKSQTYIKKDRDFFLHAKPGYAPYPYPHPLTLGGQANSPNTPSVSEKPDAPNNKPNPDVAVKPSAPEKQTKSAAPKYRENKYISTCFRKNVSIGEEKKNLTIKMLNKSRKVSLCRTTR